MLGTLGYPKYNAFCCTECGELWEGYDGDQFQDSMVYTSARNARGREYPCKTCDKTTKFIRITNRDLSWVGGDFE